MHRGRQEQIRLKALRDDEQLATDLEQARLDRESFLAEEEREREKEMRKRQVNFIGGVQNRLQRCTKT